MGFTHKARIFGIIPGFFDMKTDAWIARSPILEPIADLLAFFWMAMRQVRGEHPDFMFELVCDI